MRKDIRSSTSPKALGASLPVPTLGEAMDEVRLSVDRFCLLAGIEALQEMMEEDATAVCGARHRRHGARRGYRWGRTQSEIGYHGGRVKVHRPRVRDRAGKEVSLESWQMLGDGDLLLEWALNLMVLNVSTRKYHRAVRLPEGDLAKTRGEATSKSAVSRRFVALSRKKMKAWLASDLSELDLLVIQIDGLRVGDHVLVAAIGVDEGGEKHVLAVVEGATENTVVVQALLDNLLGRGLDPSAPRLFIVDGAKALSKAIRNTFGNAAAIQRCQVHKGRNIIERLDESLHTGVKKALRQAWDQDDAEKAERLLRNLARRLEHEAPGVSGSILEGLDEILTVIRLGLPPELRRSLACTNIIENALGTARQVSRNVKRWRNGEMALRWTATGMLEAQKTFRRLKAYRQLPILRSALQDHMRKLQANSAIETIMKAA
jgi:transposase-like protein